MGPALVQWEEELFMKTMSACRRFRNYERRNESEEDEHRRREHSFLRANRDLASRIAVPVDAHAILRTLTMEARIDSELARLELEAHQRRHTLVN